MQEIKNVYAISIEFEPNQKYNRQVFVLASTFEGALKEMKEQCAPLQDNETIKAIAMIAESVIY